MEIIIDDISTGMASLRVYSTQWVDFLHVVKARDEWRLFHVTWHDQGSGQAVGNRPWTRQLSS